MRDCVLLATNMAWLKKYNIGRKRTSVSVRRSQAIEAFAVVIVIAFRLYPKVVRNLEPIGGGGFALTRRALVATGSGRSGRHSGAGMHGGGAAEGRMVGGSDDPMIGWSDGQMVRRMFRNLASQPANQEVPLPHDLQRANAGCTVIRGGSPLWGYETFDPPFIYFPFQLSSSC
jgi:hypothetical protein